MRWRRVILWSVIATAGLVAGVVAGCNTSGCTDNRSSLLLAGFYNSSGKKITVNSLEIGGVGAPGDSLLVELKSTVGQVYLPLRSTRNETSFYIHYGQKGLDDPVLNDTIELTYDSTPYFASVECGAVYNYRIRRLSYTRHVVDSIGLVDSLVNNANVERMKIIFRTAQ